MTSISGFRFCLPLDAQAGPASRISRSRAADIVAAAMNLEVNSRVNVKRPPRRQPWRKAALLVAASLVLPVTVVAGAVRYVAARRSTSVLFAPTMMPAPRPETTTPRPSEASVARATNTSADPPPTENVDSVAVDAPRAVETARTKPAAAPHRSPVPEATPQDMLQTANDLRVRHQWLAATQLYEKTLRTFPGRAEAYSAMVAAGVLRLDQLGDPRGALALFSSAIRARPRGALSEEARWGATQAHRALGDRSAEAAALQEFVMLYPQSLQAWRAQARLRELRGDVGSP